MGEAWKWSMYVQGNPLNGSPDNGSICLLVYLFNRPVLKYCMVKICRLMVQSTYWFNFWWTKLRNHKSRLCCTCRVEFHLNFEIYNGKSNLNFTWVKIRLAHSIIYKGHHFTLSTDLCKNIPARFGESLLKCAASHPKNAKLRNVSASHSPNLAVMFLHDFVHTSNQRKVLPKSA